MENGLQDLIRLLQVPGDAFWIIQRLGQHPGLHQQDFGQKLDVFIIVYLDNILIYTEDESQGHIEAVQWVLDFLRKSGLFANLKKCQFYQNKVCFLGYIVSAQEVQIEDEKIEAVRNWPEPKSVKDIQVFLGFANFY